MFCSRSLLVYTNQHEMFQSIFRMSFVTLNVTSSEVKWGTVSGKLDKVKKVRVFPYAHMEMYNKNCKFQATTSSYSAKDMCDSPATDYGFMNPGMISTVFLDG